MRSDKDEGSGQTELSYEQTKPSLPNIATVEEPVERECTDIDELLEAFSKRETAKPKQIEVKTTKKGIVEVENHE